VRSSNLVVTDLAESATSVVLLRLLETLPVRTEQRSGYARDLFDHWVDADGDRCDARREVLISEAVVAPTVGTNCSLSGGQWASIYDGRAEAGNGSGFDVDHLVPLAEAWDSGAYGWDRATRRRFANDLSYAHSLVAVSATSNRSKGAKDPAEWLPPDVAVHCWYAEAWIQVKTRWVLAVDEAEAQALRQLISRCGDWQLGAIPQTAVVTAALPTTTAPTAAATESETAANELCHPAYTPCLPNLEGDALNCGDIPRSQKPVQIKTIGVDPYKLDRDRNGEACTA